ncbi:MAG: HEAT repeat domain-containing protein [Acidobacteria bacterium]|nr:HEAT repeat domain-containing protein [Acidobacteriota bacterium]
MPPAPTTEPMSAEQSATLAEFARTCKAAARAVSLYPATHPAIQTSLARVSAAAARLSAAGDVTLTVHPGALVVDGRAPVRPDAAIGEVADLLHERLVGALRMERAADTQDWHALLLLLARTPEDVIADGGVAKAWAASGREHFEIREIDYAEVLRERAGGEGAEWDRIIAYCLQGESASLDERALAVLLDTLGDASKFGELLDRVQATSAGGASMGARAAALLQLIRRLMEASSERSGAEGGEIVLQTAANAASRLTPDMLLALLGEARSASAEDAPVAAAVVERMSEGTIASFVAGAVVAERGATERLAQAFEALVPELDRKQRLLSLAKDEAQQSPLGQEAGFETLWQTAAQMLTSYTDKTYVSDEYARELSGARTQALDVERVSDDPPERVQGWLSTVDDAAVRQLDLTLLLDLVRLEADPERWRPIAKVVVSEIERRTLLGEVDDAQRLVEAIGRELGEEGRDALRAQAESAIDALAGGPLVRHVVLHLRKVDDREVERFSRVCHTIGPRVIRPLAEALAAEENNRAIRRLRELLLDFGAAGRHSVEQLKNSPNPAVRRTAIDLLRVFGGREALPELASMLDDADPQVQREAIRAIVQIGTEEAYAVLERALVAGSASRETILQQLIGLRDDKAVPLLCYVLNHSAPRGRLVAVHVQIIEALSGLSMHPESTRTLRTVLYRGDWWAPFRTAALRQAAAAALRRIGTADTLAVLNEAASSGSRGVRNAARPHAGLPAKAGSRPRRDPSTLREPQGRLEQGREATGSGSPRATSRGERDAT